MKKIIGIIHPFDVNQTLYVYQDGNKIDAKQVEIDWLPETIVALSRIYETYQVDLSGAKHYAKGLVKQIQQLEFTKYQENKLDIKII